MSTDSADLDQDMAEGSEPWITAIDAFKRYGKPATWLRAQARQKNLRTRQEGERTLYAAEDLDRLTGTPVPDNSAADLLRGARDVVDACKGMAAQAQNHLEKMFPALQAAQQKILELQSAHILQQNEHILKLEIQALDMREAAEKAMSLEHERKLRETSETHRQALQSRALDSLTKTMGPWLQGKLGGGAPPPVAESGADAQFKAIGQTVVGILATMPDDKFLAMRPLLGDDEWGALDSLRNALKGTT